MSGYEGVRHYCIRAIMHFIGKIELGGQNAATDFQHWKILIALYPGD